MVKVDMDDFPIKGAMKIDIDDLGADSNDDGCFPKNPQSQEIPQYDEEDHHAFDHRGKDNFEMITRDDGGDESDNSVKNEVNIEDFCNGYVGDIDDWCFPQISDHKNPAIQRQIQTEPLFPIN